MQTSDFDFIYPENLVATEPQKQFRTMWVSAAQLYNKTGAADELPREINRDDIHDLFQPGDLLIINDSKVLRRRVTALNGLEILFTKNITESAGEMSQGEQMWEVFFPAREVRDHQKIALPGGRVAELMARGLPQKLKISFAQYINNGAGPVIDENYFEQFGELALPPYIQKARGERHNRQEDAGWYQTAWASSPGSQAAPTASLHFDLNDLEKLQSKGVYIAPITLHIGSGTFLPIKTEKITDHKMHSEQVSIPRETIAKIQQVKASGARIWALGTTAVRAVESWAHGHLSENEQGDVRGETEIFIQPGFEFKIISGLLTNFHQPRSTLISLVSAFSTREKVLASYKWAIENKFRLFSYGDLSIWTR